MDWLTFVSSMINSLAWPVAVIVSIALVRKPLGEILENYKHLKVKYKDLEIGLERAVQELVTTADIFIEEAPQTIETTDRDSKSLQLAELSPRGAILETWLDFEDFLRRLCLSKGMSTTRVGGLRGHILPLSSAEMIQELVDAGVLGPKAENVMEQLRKVRNQAVHLTDSAITYEMVKDYVEVAAGLKAAIEGSINKALTPTA